MDHVFSCLSTDIVKSQIEKLKFGNVIFSIKITDLENIIIPNPDIKKQSKIEGLIKEITDYKTKLLEAETELKKILKENKI